MRLVWPIPRRKEPVRLRGVCPYDEDLEPQKAEEWYQRRYAEASDWEPPRPLNIQTFERYEWRCYLCGENTPEELMGQHVPDAPTVDHVVPLCMGGTDLDTNLACACLWCNVRKCGKHPVLYWREQRNMSLQALADLIDVSTIRLEQIECGVDHRGIDDIFRKLSVFGYAKPERKLWSYETVGTVRY